MSCVEMGGVGGGGRYLISSPPPLVSPLVSPLSLLSLSSRRRQVSLLLSPSSRLSSLSPLSLLSSPLSLLLLLSSARGSRDPHTLPWNPKPTP